jgi:hypothetical protein
MEETNVHYWVKEDSYKKLYTVQFQLHDTLEKAKLWGQ